MKLLYYDNQRVKNTKIAETILCYANSKIIMAALGYWVIHRRNYPVAEAAKLKE